ncbi:hypothetical protein [Wolbachia endosymbiont of Dactylopius coccus]
MFIWLNYHFFSPSSYFLSTEPSNNKKSFIDSILFYSTNLL